MLENIYTVYAPANDMTFIMRETFFWNDPRPDATECIGFYFGTPDPETTELCIGKLKAEF